MLVGFNLSSWKTWAVAAAAVAATSVGIERTWSYLKTGHFLIGKTIQEHVPIEFEIARLDQMIQEANHALRQDEQAMAMMEVQCEQLQEEIDRIQGELQQSEGDMRRLREALNTSDSRIAIGNKTYSREEVEGELERRLDEYEFRMQSMNDKEKALKERRAYLDAGRKQLETNHRTVQQLALQVQYLRDQKRLLDSQPASGSPAFDKSKVGEANRLASELIAKMKAEQKVREKFLAPHRIELPKEEGSVAERFDKRFGAATAKTASGGDATAVKAIPGDRQ
jgi:hypothetical protein